MNNPNDPSMRDPAFDAYVEKAFRGETLHEEDTDPFKPDMTCLNHIENGFSILLNSLLYHLKIMVIILYIVFGWPLYLLSKLVERYGE